MAKRRKSADCWGLTLIDELVTALRTLGWREAQGDQVASVYYLLRLEGLYQEEEGKYTPRTFPIYDLYLILDENVDNIAGVKAMKEAVKAAYQAVVSITRVQIINVTVDYGSDEVGDEERKIIINFYDRGEVV